MIIVETTGDQIVAVKRTDIDLDSREGRELCIADNASAKANIEWDEKNIQQIQSDWAIDQQDWGVSMPEPETEEPQDTKKELDTRLIVECGDVSKLSLLFSELQDRGFKCELKE